MLATRINARNLWIKPASASLFVTGMHLSPEFGMTVDEIINDGLIDKKVEMLLSSDTSIGISQSLSLGVSGLPMLYKSLNQIVCYYLAIDLKFAAAIAATIGLIPIAHIHGGETTEGAYDEAMRHSITKMAQLHFVAAETYRKRVIQLGENPKTVHNVGGLGVDSIEKLTLLDKMNLQKRLNFELQPKNLMVTFHPTTLDNDDLAKQFDELLQALTELKGFGLIFTMPNADSNGRLIMNKIEQFCAQNPNSKCFISLGQLLYFSTIKYCDAVVGNSSSGLLEVPTFKVGTVNIGKRQAGRLKADSIIDCFPEKTSILNAIKKFVQTILKNVSSLPKILMVLGGHQEKLLIF